MSGDQKLGKKLIESSDVVVYHHRRALFKPHLKQVSRFGEHRGLFVKKFPENSVKISYFLPSLLVISFFAGILLSLFFPLFWYILALGIVAYLALSLFAAVSQVKSIRQIVLVWSGIIVTHLVYGSYFLSGLAKRDLER